MVDTHASRACDSNVMGVQVPPSAQQNINSAIMIQMEQQPQSQRFTDKDIAIAVRGCIAISHTSEEADSVVQGLIPKLAEPNDGEITDLIIGRYNYVKQIFGIDEKTEFPVGNSPNLREIKYRYDCLLNQIIVRKYNYVGPRSSSGSDGEGDGYCSIL
jgi:hypothetical protein